MESQDNALSPGSLRLKAMSLIAVAMEAILLVMVCLSPWAYGAVHPGFEFLLDTGLGILLVLWAGRMLLAGQLIWKKSAVAVCLGGLFLIGMWQLTPLPQVWLEQLSPATARLYHMLLPSHSEVLPLGEARDAVNPPPGSTISLYPAVTRQLSLQILAVFLLFAVMHNNIASPAALRRLAFAALLNGTLLSMFALIQFLSSEPHTLYWKYKSLGQVFGPFINRNHFAAYVNLCIGLGVGLLVSRSATRAADSRRGPGRRTDGSSARDSGRLGAVAELLDDPPSLAICLALGLMGSSVFMSLSRGGMLALAGGTVVFAVTMAVRSPRPLRLGVGLLMAAVAVALASTFGYGLIKTRLATLQQNDAAGSRTHIWSLVWPLVSEFPWWGTGYGTFQYLERMHRPGAVDAEILYEHAHNDYLELLLEGGIPALVLGLVAILAIYGRAFRAIGRRGDLPTGGLVAGALLGFTTLVLHSVGEFPTHVPAITLLATVMCAQIYACGHLSPMPRGRGAGGPELPSPPPQLTPGPAPLTPTNGYRVSLWGLAPLLGAAVSVALGALICAAGWKAHQIDRLKTAAVQATDDEARIGYLKAAAAVGPDDAALQAELGNAILRHVQRKGLQLPKRAESAQLTPALRAYLTARDACPLLSEVQLGLAAHAPDFDSADPQWFYLLRAQYLAPSDPEVWYTSGLLELAAHKPVDAWESWRRSLELSDRYLPQILAKSAGQLTAAQLVDKVIPHRPEKLLAAASWVGPKSAADRQFFLEKAILLFPSRLEAMTAQELLTKAQIHRALGQDAQALAAYRARVDQEPEQVTYRYELAKYLYDLGRLREARDELLTAQAQDPTDGPTRSLLETVTRDLSRKR